MNARVFFPAKRAIAMFAGAVALLLVLTALSGRAGHHRRRTGRESASERRNGDRLRFLWSNFGIPKGDPGHVRHSDPSEGLSHRGARRLCDCQRRNQGPRRELRAGGRSQRG